jgi:hypothetical protein
LSAVKKETYAANLSTFNNSNAAAVTEDDAANKLLHTAKVLLDTGNYVEASSLLLQASDLVSSAAGGDDDERVIGTLLECTDLELASNNVNRAEGYLCRAIGRHRGAPMASGGGREAAK